MVGFYMIRAQPNRKKQFIDFGSEAFTESIHVIYRHEFFSGDILLLPTLSNSTNRQWPDTCVYNFVSGSEI